MLIHPGNSQVRPGRFDVVVEIGTPTEADREAIIRFKLKGTPTAPEFDHAEAARLFGMGGLSCAEVMSVVNSGCVAALGGDEAVGMGHLIGALTALQTSRFALLSAAD